MATKFEFYLSDADTDRLFYSKEEAGENELTGNEYAEQLLHSALYKLCDKTSTLKKEVIKSFTQCII